jgi:hypothetical protein
LVRPKVVTPVHRRGYRMGIPPVSAAEDAKTLLCSLSAGAAD